MGADRSWYEGIPKFMGVSILPRSDPIHYSKASGHGDIVRPRTAVEYTIGAEASWVDLDKTARHWSDLRNTPT